MESKSGFVECKFVQPSFGRSNVSGFEEALECSRQELLVPAGVLCGSLISSILESFVSLGKCSATLEAKTIP